MDIQRLKSLVNELNKYRDAYYNRSESLVSDEYYDQLFDQLKVMEASTGIVMANSPTQNVGYEVKSNLEKTTHSHPMLSLDKTKDIDEIKKFVGDQLCLLMCKMDGLTVLLTYEDGYLVQAETRGNGEVGEIVTHNAKVFDNIPLYIDYPGHLEVEGEAIITYNDFNKINSNISDDDKKYKNPRNLVSGSVRQLDSHIAAKRHIKFIAWKIPKGMDNIGAMYERLNFAYNLGFDVVPTIGVGIRNATIEDNIRELKDRASKLGYPIDGMVVTYDDIKYGESLGMTGHHPKHSLAFKFYDEEVETVLRDIEWGMGKTGQLTPVAVFDPVEIDGTIVERASLHNISIMEDLELSYGDTITVYKANMIIPQIKNNLDRSLIDICTPPLQCPICGHNTKVVKEKDTEVLMCMNAMCKGKLLGELTAFVSKKAHDIQGLSEATLSLLIQTGLVESAVDLYHLSDKRKEMSYFPRMGVKKIENILKSIEKSRMTSLSKFIAGLNIPLIGGTASKDIEKYEIKKAYLIGYDYAVDCFIEDIENDFDFTCIDGIGDERSLSIHKYYEENKEYINCLLKEFHFPELKKKDNVVTEDPASLAGKKFCITGSLSVFKNRDELKEDIETKGGKVVSSVTKQTDYLITNNKNSGSSKNKKAAELCIPIITEQEYLKI